MELFSLPSSRLIVSPSSSPKVFIQKHPLLPSHNPINVKRHSNARKLKFYGFRPQASDSMQASSKSNPGMAQASKQDILSKDENVVFVAGATGKVGSRTVRELLKLGFQVRAGVRSAQKAETLVQSVQEMKLEGGASAVEKLEIVECDLEKDRIEPAIASASVVICCIGASEKEVFDVTGPYRIDYQATKNLIDAATMARVDHFILLTSLGTNKIGFPAAILNLFWGVLIWKRKAEEALIASGLPYTVVRPGGMERPTDTYKETHNISLSKEDTLFGGQVSNLQVAELMAFMAKNRITSFCKVVEVIAETTAPLTPFGELLSKIPSQRVDSSLPKEPQAARTSDPAPSQNILPETINPVIEKEPFKAKVQISSPLSPYVTYEDLKPPTSPIPTQSTSRTAVKVKDANAEQESNYFPQGEAVDKECYQVEKLKTTPLSPYILYDDLKPPTSPTPTASTSTKKQHAVADPSAVAPQIDILGPKTEVSEVTATPVEVKESRSHSPYNAYEDLKLPAFQAALRTTTPKIGSVSAALPLEETVLLSSGASDVTEKTPAQVVEKELLDVPNQKPRHLSPYPMYEDLKPPSSPIPLSRKN